MLINTIVLNMFSHMFLSQTYTENTKRKEVFKMRSLMGVILLLCFVVIMMGIIGFMMRDDGTCSDSSNQYVSDDKWYELCKDE